MREPDAFDFVFRLVELIEEARNALMSNKEILLALQEVIQAVRNERL